jgi:hypothetical protein
MLSLPTCPDDRALRRHIHSIPPQYILLLDMKPLPALLLLHMVTKSCHDPFGPFQCPPSRRQGQSRPGCHHPNHLQGRPRCLLYCLLGLQLHKGLL